MFKLLVTLFLTIHILADFYFQSSRIAEKKRGNYVYVLLHGLCYFLVSFICMIPFWSVWLLVSIGLLSVLHLAADSVKFLYTMKKEQNATLYVTDQLVHLTCIAIVASILVYLGYELMLLPTINGFLLTITKDLKAMFQCVGMILMAYKPTNITIKRLIEKYKPVENDSDTPNKSGAFIGTLERMIILLMLSAGQYAAIGLVLTAKSVARYNKISEDKKFAEYYLLGTLLSTLFAISSYFLFS